MDFEREVSRRFNGVDFNDPDVIEWACEMIGVEYKRLPLTHHQKQRFLSLSVRNPNLEYPKNRQRKVFAVMTPPTVVKASSATAETALIAQYDAEIQKLSADADKLMERAQALSAQVREMRTKRSRVAKALGLIEKTVEVTNV